MKLKLLGIVLIIGNFFWANFLDLYGPCMNTCSNSGFQYWLKFGGGTLLMEFIVVFPTMVGFYLLIMDSPLLSTDK